MTKKPVYVIQEHHASHLHWDLRLERNKTLKSWAIPKKPSKTQKRLAIQVDNHPIEYAKFQGEIPKGQYGAGKVIIWDSGWYEPIEWEKNKILINIHGKKLNGKFALIKFKDQEKNWLFIKTKD